MPGQGCPDPAVQSRCRICIRQSPSGGFRIISSIMNFNNNNKASPEQGAIKSASQILASQSAREVILQDLPSILG